MATDQSGSSPPPLPPMPSGTPQWHSLRGLATALKWLFIFDVVGAAILIGALANRLSVIDDIDDAGYTFRILERADDADSFASGAAVLLLAGMLGTAVCFIVWMWRAAKNNEALGRTGARFGPGWAIGGWFIPIANLVIPFLMMQDLWRGSDPSTPRDDHQWRASGASTLVGWWWATVVATSILRIVAGGGSSDDERHSLDEIRRSNRFALVGAVITIAAAVLATRVVRSLTDRQEECLRAQHDSAAR